MSQVFSSLSGEFENVEDIGKVNVWKNKLAFNEWRHLDQSKEPLEPKEKVIRVKERLKTLSVALVLCLNVGVDPPDIVKPIPCAKTECWLDPFTMPPDKSLEEIAKCLTLQYEKYHPRARYKQALDPKLEDVKKLCTSLRKSAKEDRVLFHYNGHGVPKPTTNGEIWVFNRDYTQYLPLSVYDLQSWMGPNSVFVYDCSAAGEILKNFNNFAIQREQEYELVLNNPSMLNGYNLATPPPNFNQCIQFGACSSDQILPMNPDLPADLFTSCLTTPIKMSLKYYMIQKTNRLLPGITEEMLDFIPGSVQDRRTILGEFNWVMTTIIDTIAWDILPRETFQKLFRQDLLVSILSRHFILAQRIMSSYDCTPISSPEIPFAPKHPMWATWDYVLDQILAQLPAVLDNKAHYTHSSFFIEHLTAFHAWLSFGVRVQNELRPKVELLPIVLQVLLSNIHRLKALDLFSRFFSLGDWAVHAALSVGIFPYLFKLLQSPDREIREVLVYMWSKIFALDGSCQNDLIADNAYLYFLRVLSDTKMISDYKIMAAFVMASFVRNFYTGQDLAYKANLIAICLEQLNDPNPLLRQWLCICLGLTWNNHRDARWCGVRDTAHEKLFVLLSDPVPDVRASAVFALGTFINSEKTDHANTIDHAIGMKLIASVGKDGSPLVRKELISALQWLVLLFETQFVAIAFQIKEEERKKSLNKEDALHLSPTGNSDSTPPSGNTSNHIKRVSSTTSLQTFSNISYSATGGIGNVFGSVWKQLLTLSYDAHFEVALLADSVINRIRSKVSPASSSASNPLSTSIRESQSDPFLSEPSSPMTNSFINETVPQDVPKRHNPDGIPNITIQPTKKDRVSSDAISSACKNKVGSNSANNSLNQNRERQTSEGSSCQTSVKGSTTPVQLTTILTPFQHKRKIFGREPNTDKIRDELKSSQSEKEDERKAIVDTHFIESCIKCFHDCLSNFAKENDMESKFNQKREWKFWKNYEIRKTILEESSRIDFSKTDEQVFIQRSNYLPLHLKFHPFEPYLFVAERESFSIWQWENSPGTLIGTFSNGNDRHSRISSMQLINTSEETSVMFGCDDGSVRLWNIFDIHPDIANKPRLVTAFNIFSDMNSSNTKQPGLLLQWEQLNSRLVAAGNCKVIRVWDANKEMKVRDIITGSDNPPITALHTDDNYFICAGCQDGSVRIFDRRLPNNESRVITFRDHTSPVIEAHLYNENEKHIDAISGSSAGDVKLWDKRMQSKCLKTIQIPNCTNLTAMSVHSTEQVFACATNSNSIHIYTLDGIPGSVIKYYDGFISQHLGPISCLTHHPLKGNLAMGCTDSTISVYTSTKSINKIQCIKNV